MNDSEAHEQVAMMDTIYEHAELNLIAAAGQDP